MCRFCQGIAGIVLLAAVAACSDPGTQDGKVPFKGTSTEKLNSMTNEMKKNQQANAQKAEEEAKAKPKEAKPEEPSKAKEAQPEGPSKTKEAQPAEAKTPGKSG